MEINFQGKRALVTGAGKGIGRATAVRLAELGAHVTAVSRTQADLESLKAQSTSVLSSTTNNSGYPDQMLCFHCGGWSWSALFATSEGPIPSDASYVPSIETCFLDIADWDKTRGAVEQMGPIDLLVNNAGITNWVNFLELTKEELYNVHDINFKAAVNISQVVARGMVARGSGGAIVNVSSIASKRVAPNSTAYCTSKAAMGMLTSTMAMDLGPHNIRVNSVNPGVVMTTMGKLGWSDPELRKATLNRTPLRKFSEESDVADVIMFLLSDRAAMVTGSSVPVDGGILHVL